MDLATYIPQKVDKICVLAQKVTDTRATHNYDRTVDAYCNLIKSCVEMTNSVKKDACEACCRTDINEELGKIVEAKMCICGEITKFTIESLLPIRIKGYHVYEREVIDKIFLSPLIDLMHNKNARMYKEKVVICFIHHFGKGSRLIDHDNFEIKPFVDCIASVMLPDDSPDFLSYYMDHKMSEKDYTEIFLVPNRIFADFLINIKGDANEI